MARPIGWHHEDIKAALRKQHGPITSISESWGYNRFAISNVLRDPRYSTVIEERIAKTLGRSVSELWPDRWLPDGTPRPRARPQKSSGRALADHRQKQAQA